jgi:esterase/lipase
MPGSAKRAGLYAIGLTAVCLGLAAIVPIGVGALGPQRAPIRGYEAGLARAAQVVRADSDAARGGGSIILLHGHRTPRVVVLFHGFTNSPRQYRQLAAALYRDGDNVFAPRLPAQGLAGATAHTLSRLTARALRDAGDRAVDLSCALGDTVVVMGISLGADLTAWTAQFRPEVDRAVIVAPALALARVPSLLATPAMNLALRLPDYSDVEPPDPLRPDRTLGWSTHAVGQMLLLSAAVQRAARRHAPVARDIRLVVNANDRTVSRGAIDELAAHWIAHGAKVRMYEFPASLKLPHDVVDPDEPDADTAATYPVFVALIHGTAPTVPTVDSRERSEPVVRRH